MFSLRGNNWIGRLELEFLSRYGGDGVMCIFTQTSSYVAYLAHCFPRMNFITYEADQAPYDPEISCISSNIIYSTEPFTKETARNFGENRPGGCPVLLVSYREERARQILLHATVRPNFSFMAWGELDEDFVEGELVLSFGGARNKELIFVVASNGAKAWSGDRQVLREELSYYNNILRQANTKRFELLIFTLFLINAAMVAATATATTSRSHPPSSTTTPIAWPTTWLAPPMGSSPTCSTSYKGFSSWLMWGNDRFPENWFERRAHRRLYLSIRFFSNPQSTP